MIRELVKMLFREDPDLVVILVSLIAAAILLLATFG